MSSMQIDSGFDDAVGAVGEEVVGVPDASERVAVGYQMGGIDLAFGNQLHYFVAVAGIDDAGLEREVLAIHPRQRQYLSLLVERNNRCNGIGPGAMPCKFKSILSSGNLNHSVGSTPLCQ